MLEHIAVFTAWPILTGIFIGYIANRIMSGEGKGCCMNLVIGIVGSYVGTFISHLLNIELLGKGYLTNFVFCVVGAVTFLWIWKKLFDWVYLPQWQKNPRQDWTWRGAFYSDWRDYSSTAAWAAANECWLSMTYERTGQHFECKSYTFCTFCTFLTRILLQKLSLT